MERLESPAVGSLEQELGRTSGARYSGAGRGAAAPRATPARCGGTALEAGVRPLGQHAERVVAISRSLGDPVVNVAVGGAAAGAPGGCFDLRGRGTSRWYEYEVRLDLYEQTVAVDEARRGDDPRDRLLRERSSRTSYSYQEMSQATQIETTRGSSPALDRHVHRRVAEAARYRHHPLDAGRASNASSAIRRTWRASPSVRRASASSA